MSALELLPADRGLAPHAVSTEIDYRDRYRGALLGVGIGDALGRPAEGKGPGWVRADYGVIEDFIPWRGWRGGPKDTLTDDSKLTIALAESLIDCGEMDPVDFGRLRGEVGSRRLPTSPRSLYSGRVTHSQNRLLLARPLDILTVYRMDGAVWSNTAIRESGLGTRYQRYNMGGRRRCQLAGPCDR